MLSCKEQKSRTAETHFTKEDSITDRYLVLQDSLLYVWNLMINDDNQKLKAMSNVLHELSIGKQASNEDIEVLQKRLEQLPRIRFTQRTMHNPDVIEEYDFASNNVMSEIISLTVGSPNYEQNTTLQNLVELINLADQRTLLYRADYDAIANSYNTFLERNLKALRSIDATCSEEKKALFEISQSE
ncbi:hypothetical protein SanaruYs_32750 [Chryseotalea sanaruensis]|uniref:Uncharacterized protein n=2 Tax=Chryseotalea sanaruensis TaxID=2482724 RepID=A0A401UDU6_9BACT|nr:hypothetical protein SanaruYs_32750 [Chryseotalea sanaruensis]